MIWSVNSDLVSGAVLNILDREDAIGQMSQPFLQPRAHAGHIPLLVDILRLRPAYGDFEIPQRAAHVHRS